MKPINNLIIKSASAGGCKSAERAPPSYDPGRTLNCGVGWPRAAERNASVQLARKGEKKGKEEEESLHRWMVGTIVMMVMMLPSRA